MLLHVANFSMFPECAWHSIIHLDFYEFIARSETSSFIDLMEGSGLIHHAHFPKAEHKDV